MHSHCSVNEIVKHKTVKNIPDRHKVDVREVAEETKTTIPEKLKKNNNSTIKTATRINSQQRLLLSENMISTFFCIPELHPFARVLIIALLNTIFHRHVAFKSWSESSD